VLKVVKRIAALTTPIHTVPLETALCLEGTIQVGEHFLQHEWHDDLAFGIGDISDQLIYIQSNSYYRCRMH